MANLLNRLECEEKEGTEGPEHSCNHVSQTTEKCEEQPFCEAQFAEWSSWSACSKTCTYTAEEQSWRSRIRTCTSNRLLDCEKGSVQREVCQVETCSVGGKYMGFSF